MALKLNIPFPIFSPRLLPGQNPCPSPNPNPNPSPANHQRGPSEVRFSRWNNANAERFNERRRAQEEIEADIRRHRRFDAASRIAQTHDSAAATEPETMPFKSRGTPSSPSPPSIPSKKSKYSKPDRGFESKPKNKPQVPITTPQVETKPVVKLSDDGLSYVIDGAPFEFKYSYTETPKVKPLKLREPPYAPFGPTTMGRPWTGRPPLPPSKKKLREFDSFQLPPPGKKGVKPVQKPGPFLSGSGPRYVYTREEILGEPLTKEEIKELVKGCMKTRRQLNMGRDGLTHNMLDNTHDLWKRHRVCKIKCKGVCTVDMDSVCQQLEEKTGGKIIYRNGGVLFLFRGRNYNYRTRPRFPLMLWKPVSPVYPRLIQRAPEGLTLEEATEMRRKGRELIPICKLAKNGVYCDLAKHVREAFEVCELVRINCQGIKGSDYRKIGAKLKDLVPCVLISFENEHILIWRGRDWKTSLSTPDNKDIHFGENAVDAATSVAPPMGDQEASVPSSQSLEIVDAMHRSSMGSTETQIDPDSDDQASIKENESSINVRSVMKTEDVTLEGTNNSSNVTQAMEKADGDSFSEKAEFLDGSESTRSSSLGEITELTADSSQKQSVGLGLGDDQQPENLPETTEEFSKPANRGCTERVRNLMKQAEESGIALVLDDSDLDADVVFAKAVAFAKTAPPGPLFQHRPGKPKVKKEEDEQLEDPDTEEIPEKHEVVLEKVGKQKQSIRKREDDLDGDYRDVLPHGTLRVDELAKLLA